MNLRLKRFSVLFPLFLSFLSLVSGCAVVKPFSEKSYQLNEGITVTIGSTMIYWANGKYVNGEKTGTGKELIYTGIDHNVLQVKYREYDIVKAGDFARTAFYQDLKYDLALSSQITFQEFILRIDSADQEHVVFKVLKEAREVQNLVSEAKLGIWIEDDGFISEVDRGSEAESSGLVKNDRILKINGVSVPYDKESIIRLLRNRGAKTGIEILRNGKKIIVELKR